MNTGKEPSPKVLSKIRKELSRQGRPLLSRRQRRDKQWRHSKSEAQRSAQNVTWPDVMKGMTNHEKMLLRKLGREATGERIRRKRR